MLLIKRNDMNELIIDHNLIKKSSSELQTSLNKIVENYDESVKYFKRKIKCEYLEDKHFREDIRDDDKFKELFESLDEGASTLYIFEMTSHHSTIEVKKRFTDYSKSSTRKRNVPSYIETTTESRILYVGKSQKGFWVRLICHLGVGMKETWHGLQLLHWAKNINLELTLHIYQFNNGVMSNNLLRTMEKDLAEKLFPVIGMHNV